MSLHISLIFFLTSHLKYKKFPRGFA